LLNLSYLLIIVRLQWHRPSFSIVFPAADLWYLAPDHQIR